MVTREGDPSFPAFFCVSKEWTVLVKIRHGSERAIVSVETPPFASATAYTLLPSQVHLALFFRMRCTSALPISGIDFCEMKKFELFYDFSGVCWQNYTSGLFRVCGVVRHVSAR